MILTALVFSSALGAAGSVPSEPQASPWNLGPGDLQVAAGQVPPAMPTPPPPAPGPPGRRGSPPGPVERLHQHLFPPELVMEHQVEIDLTGEQRRRLIKEIKEAQGSMVELQFALKEAEAQLAAQLDQPRVDDAKALAAADKLMGLEHKIKRNHLALLLRVKSVLTAEQQAKLQELRPEPEQRRAKRRERRVRRERRERGR